MIDKQSQITELYEFRHFHDDTAGNDAFDYENNLLPTMMSSAMYKNPTTREFLDRLQKNCVWMLEATLVIRNFFNYTVDKYYNKHTN